MIDTAHWSESERQRWQAIAAHRFENPAHRPDFVGRLARGHGWSRDTALAAVEEYRRYCFLAVVADHIVTPAVDVDEVWHLHLTETRDYWDVFCVQALGRILHHEPSRGGSADQQRHRTQYAQTLASYQRYFDAPPLRFWPPLVEQFANPSRWQRVDLQQVRVLTRRPRLTSLPAWRSLFASPLLRKAAAAFAVALAVVLAMPRALAAAANPLDWSGASFLQLFVILLIVASLLAWWLRRRLRDNGEHPAMAGLDAASVAWLGGGAERVVDSSVAELMARGVAHWDEATQRLQVDRDSVRELDYPLDLVAEQLGVGTPVSALPKLLMPRLDRLQQRLLQRGLLLDAAQAWRVRWISALPLLAVLGFGLMKINLGVQRDRPVLFLGLLCGLAALAAGFVLLRPTRRSVAGERTLEQLRERHAHATRAPRDGDLGLAVALAGTAVLGGTAYAAYHQHRHPPSDSSSSSTTSSSNSDCGDSSSSDSGSGCGGCSGGGGD